MKFSVFTLFILLNLNLTAQSVELSWKFTDPRDGKQYDLGKSGSVQEGLLEQGLLPDPFDQLNEKLYLWVEDHLWTCESRFFLSEEQFEANFLELEFPSIDTYAQIFLNDSLILETNNAFKAFSKNIKPFVKLGYNRLRVVFTPPVIFHKEEYDTMSYHLPAINDVHPIAVAPMVRKPQYQFGWDWALRINTIGFNKPVQLHAYQNNRVITKNVQTQVLQDTSANLLFTLNFSEELNQGEEYYWVSKMFGTEKIRISKDKSIEREVILSRPRLWWPRGHGSAYLYHDTWKIMDSNGGVVAEENVEFGVRSSELVQKEDKWGTSYEIWVNNKAIFCKGADYIPQDIFLSRITKDQRLELVRIMDESNINMVRIWGGGMYAEDDFLSECDKRGIMVWHDLMFACSIYPGDSAFLANVKGELEFQIPRISSHPSVVLFNGNNEVDVAWKHWGFQKRYGIHGEDAEEVERNYDKLFKELAPNTISSISTIPYIHTSPLSNWGTKEAFNHGTQHYWGVWHGKDPIEDFSRKIGRFNSEYGFQSFPEFSTLNTFSRREQWHLDSAVMQHHQKSYVGNGMIDKHAKRLYGKMPDFETFVYYSQLTQSKAVSMAVAGHRVDAPRCMGTLYWQLNDCWPAPSWSSMDYFNNWKALQYEIKKDYENVAVVQRIDDLNKEEYFLVSDLGNAFSTKVNMLVYNFRGNEIEKKSFQVKLDGISSKLLVKSTNIFRRDDNFVVFFEWENEKHESRSRWFVHEPDNYKKALPEDIEVTIDRIDSLNNTMYIKIETKKFLNDFWLSSLKTDLKFEENFIPIIPGEKIMVVKYREIPKIEDFIWMWR